MFDYINETFSGPHDFVSKWTYTSEGFYNYTKYGIGGIRHYFAETMSVLNLVTAAPLAGALTIDVYAPTLVNQYEQL